MVRPLEPVYLRFRILEAGLMALRLGPEAGPEAGPEGRPGTGPEGRPGTGLYTVLYILRLNRFILPFDWNIP